MAVIVAPKDTGSSVPELAVTVTTPAVLPSISCVLAVPSAPDTAEGELTVAVPEATANLTVTPETGNPIESVTVTTSGEPSCVPTSPVCLSPAVITSLAAAKSVSLRMRSLNRSATRMPPALSVASLRGPSCASNAGPPSPE